MRNILKLACVLFCIVGLVPNLMGCNKSTMTRDEFKAKITYGMSRQAVIDAVGTPDHTAESRDGSTFFYNNIFDPISGRAGSAFVNFDKKGMDARVSFAN